MGKIWGHIEAGGGVYYHFCGILHSGGTGGAPVRGIDVGLVRFLREADSGGPHGFFVKVEDGTWQREGTKSILKAEGTRDIWAYINRPKAKVAQWVALWPIFEVCRWEMGYEIGEQRRTPWWRQTAAGDLPRDTLKWILEDAQDQKR